MKTIQKKIEERIKLLNFSVEHTGKKDKISAPRKGKKQILCGTVPLGLYPYYILRDRLSEEFDHLVSQRDEMEKKKFPFWGSFLSQFFPYLVGDNDPSYRRIIEKLENLFEMQVHLQQIIRGKRKEYNIPPHWKLVCFMGEVYYASS